MYRNDLGLDLARVAISLAAARGSHAAAAAFASKHYGERSETAMIVRALPGSLTPSSPGWGSELGAQNAATEFWEYVRGRTVIGRLGLRDVPFKTRLLTATGGTTAGWVGEDDAISMTDMDFATDSLDPMKVGAITIFSQELANLSQAERIVRDDMARAVAAAVDAAFLSTDDTDGTVPAGIGHGASTVAATGDMAADLSALVETFQGDVTRASFIGPAGLFAAMSGPAYPGVGLSDGELLNRPCLVSGNIPTAVSPQVYSLYLVSPDDIALAEGETELEGSREGTIVLEGGEKISLWQEDLLGVRAIQLVNWRPARDAVAILTGIDVGGGA